MTKKKKTTMMTWSEKKKDNKKILEDLLEKCEKHVLIDPTLIHFSYAYCASHVHGNRWAGANITRRLPSLVYIFEGLKLR